MLPSPSLRKRASTSNQSGVKQTNNHARSWLLRGSSHLHSDLLGPSLLLSCHPLPPPPALTHPPLIWHLLLRRSHARYYPSLRSKSPAPPSQNTGQVSSELTTTHCRPTIVRMLPPAQTPPPPVHRSTHQSPLLSDPPCFAVARRARFITVMQLQGNIFFGNVTQLTDVV